MLLFFNYNVIKMMNGKSCYVKYFQALCIDMTFIDIYLSVLKYSKNLL